MRYARSAMAPTVRILAFGGARDVVGSGEVELPLAATCTAAELLATVCHRFPELASHHASLRLAVNGCYAAPGDPVKAGDEVALIPPVGGG